MLLAEVIGQVTASQKDTRLEGLRLLVVQPCDEHGVFRGRPQVAVDGLQSHDGDRVVCVRAREASLAVPGRTIPSDLSIVARVERGEDSATRSQSPGPG